MTNHTNAIPFIVKAAEAMTALGVVFDSARLADAAAGLMGRNKRTLHNCKNTIDGMIANKEARESNPSVTEKNADKWDKLWQNLDGTLRLIRPDDQPRYYYVPDKSERARRRLQRRSKSERGGYEVSPVLS